MNETVGYITLVTGIVTIIWFIRDVRKQNSKVLKSILDVEKTQVDVLAKIEEGQRKGFEMLAEGQQRMAEGQQRMAEGQRKGFETLEKGLETLQKGLEIIARLLVKTE